MRRGISTFIAVLLLTILSISAGAVIYSIMMGKIGRWNQQSSGFLSRALSLDSAICTTDELVAYVRNLGNSETTLDRAYVDSVPIQGSGYLLEVNGLGPNDDKIGAGEVGTITIRIPMGFEEGNNYQIKLISRENTQLTFTLKAYEKRSEEEIEWWDDGYSFIRRLTITTVQPLPMGYSVHFVMNTTGPNYQDDGDDLRIIYLNGSGYIELDRVNTTSFNSTDSEIWFATVSYIPMGGYDDNYFVYYGNSTVSNPPANGSRVYLWLDDFSNDSLSSYDQGKWVDIHGGSSQYSAPTYDFFNERVNFDTGDNYASDMYPKGIIVANALISVDFRVDMSYPTDGTLALVSRLKNPGISSSHYYFHYSHGSYSSPGGAYNTWTDGERNTLMYDPFSNVYWSFNQVHNLTYASFGTSHSLWYDSSIAEPPLASATHSGDISPGRWGWAPAQVKGWMDNLLIRRYVEPEPTIQIGPPQSQG